MQKLSKNELIKQIVSFKNETGICANFSLDRERDEGSWFYYFIGNIEEFSKDKTIFFNDMFTFDNDCGSYRRNCFYAWTAKGILTLGNTVN